MLHLVLVLSGAVATADTVPLYPHLGDHHYPVTTQVPAAQQYFDQGLRLHYAFNHAEAIRAFREAQRRDPSCAMCFWGEALALGPNINAPIDSASAAAAHVAAAEAARRQAGASEVERVLIAALQVRYGANPAAPRAALDSAYARAMAAAARRFPRDADVAVLYAEALMDLRPWDYWTRGGSDVLPTWTPAPGMAPALEALSRVVERLPRHPGACHFYIHLVEAAYPERAVACAERLAALMPGAGHLVHMPGHIYIRVGRYADAIRANEHAVHADESYIRDKRPGAGIYTLGYYPHNYDFLAFAAMMAEREEDAMAAADRLAALARPSWTVPGMAFTQHHGTRHLQLRVRFGRWQEILAAPAPDTAAVHARAIWHYAQGRALVATGRAAEASPHLDALRRAAADPRTQGLRIEFNESDDLLRLAAEVLAGVIASGEGRHDAAERHLREAVRLEDALTYGEPPEWSLPVRQDLGEALLRAERFPEAARAFESDLRRFPLNGWSTRGADEARRRAGAQRADLGRCAVAGGAVVEDCFVSYRTYGRLNDARDNAVLIPTWYAGRAEAMTWLLGADAWVDTTRYFAILMDAPGNGGSISPSRSARQPLDAFPRLTTEDMVDIEHRVIREHLGIPRLHAVVGWSFGGSQALAWSLRHPAAVARAVSVAGPPRMDAMGRFWLRANLNAVDRAEALGLSRAALSRELVALWHLVGSSPAVEDQLPRDSVGVTIEREIAAEYLGFHPADNRLFLQAISAIDLVAAARDASPDVRRTVVFVTEDHLTTPTAFREFVAATGARGIEVSSPFGHVIPIAEAARISALVREALAR